MITVSSVIFWFLEIFLKPPGGLYIAARRLIPFRAFLGSWRRNRLVETVPPSDT